jgi:anti-sigma B factor antagonist
MHSFSVSFRSSGPIEILTLAGELDAHTVTELDAAIVKCLRNGRSRIVVNAASLQYISSAGLGVFLGHIDEIRDQGGDLVICQLRPRVFDVFDLLGFPMLFRIVDSEDEAIDTIDAQPAAAG